MPTPTGDTAEARRIQGLLELRRHIDDELRRSRVAEAAPSPRNA